jgi:O-succinylbenzoic acid--CoA ligase
MTLMPDWVAQRAALTPERPALLTEECQLTFRELEQRVARLAGGLSALGVEVDTRVALLARNSLTYAVLVHAIPRLGGILVPLNTRLTEPELRHQVTDAEVRLILHDEDRAPLATALSHRGAPAVSLSAVPAVGTAAPRPVDLGRIRSIIYTSGTTGRPKGAMLTSGNFWWSAVGSALNLGNRTDDCWLVCLPLFHVGGLSILLRSVIYGIPALLQPGFAAEAVNRAIDEAGVTIVSVVATMLQRMLVARGGRPYPPSLRCLLLGGGPAPLPLLEAAAALDAPVFQTYGLTETASQVATLAPEDALRKLGSAGKPLFPLELRVDGARAPEEPGEIVVRGPSVMAGYLNQAGSMAADGWLHTGDLGYLDAEGYLYVLDRRDDLIVSGGENIYPAEVEAVLLAHPDVAEAGVYGVPDKEWGQVAMAAVVPAAAARPNEDALVAYCRERLADYKVPRQIRFVEHLPKTGAGKIMRRALADNL